MVAPTSPSPTTQTPIEISLSPANSGKKEEPSAQCKAATKKFNNGVAKHIKDNNLGPVAVKAAEARLEATEKNDQDSCRRLKIAMGEQDVNLLCMRSLTPFDKMMAISEGNPVKVETTDIAFNITEYDPRNDRMSIVPVRVTGNLQKLQDAAAAACKTKQ